MQINNKLIKQETVLYNNATGTNGTVNLIETATNFKYLEIFYRSAFEIRNSVKVYAPNEKSFTMQITWWRSEENKILSYVAYGSILEQTITISHSGEFNIFASSAKANSNNAIYITRVVGFR